MLRLILFVSLISISQVASAAFYMQYSLNYESDTDSGEAQEFSYNKMNNSIFFGATLDNTKTFIIGQNLTSWNKTQKKGSSDTESSLNLTEFGPKVLYYFTKYRTWFASVTYNFYVKGTIDTSGTEVEASGTSIAASLGYHYKITTRLALGASLRYHQTTIANQVEDSTSSDVSKTYTSIYPMFELSVRY